MPSLALGLGLSKNKTAVFTRSEAVIIVNDFRARVIADGGTFEAYACMVSKVKVMLDNPQIASTFILNSYMRGVFYAMGDSMTASGQYEQKIVDLDERWRFVNCGVSGERTDQMQARFIADVSSVCSLNNYVIILGGVNDLSQGYDNVHIQTQLQAMYTYAKNANMAVIAVTILPWKGNATWTSGKQVYQDLANDWIMNTAINVDYRINAYSFMGDPLDPQALLPAYDSGDHLHPNATGYAELGTGIYDGSTFTPRYYVSPYDFAEANECLQSLITLIN